jgi:S-methylmethionine-dependent homocysteine/selenocysteine methylase
MARYRQNLPQLAGTVFLTDSGLETDLVFNHGVDLPEFAAFPLINDKSGRELLQRYFADHVAVAAEHEVGIVLEAPTWRASSGWGARLGYDAEALRRVNRDCVDLVADTRASTSLPVVVSAAIGPEGDGYRPAHYLTSKEARDYHAPQLEALADSHVDMAHAMTMSYVAEAIGITDAARAVGLPIAVSFTVETDGTLPDDTTLSDAIRAVDEATDSAPAYYGINCAHPTHFTSVLNTDDDWTSRLRCLRANASAMSHAELDEAEELDDGNPTELGAQYAALRARHGALTVLGGCCGTDARHVRAIAGACL